MNDIVLALTATIHTRSTVFVERADPSLRTADYRIALEHWVREPGIGRVIFCENSGASLEELKFPVASCGRENVTWLSFCAPGAHGRLGKGYGELGILARIAEDSICGPADHILKVTGRYYLRNAAVILGDIGRNRNIELLSSRPDPNGRIPSECFYCSVRFLREFLLPKWDRVDDVRGYYFENALAAASADAVSAGHDCRFFAAKPELIGVSGTDNLPRSFRRGAGCIEFTLPHDHVAFWRFALLRYAESAHCSGDVQAVCDRFNLAYAEQRPMQEVRLANGELAMLRESLAFCLGALDWEREQPYGFTRQSAKSLVDALEGVVRQRVD